jgi:hypothetical protein
MDQEQFIKARNNLGKTQKELADLLGISLKAIQSYEQGWRSIPHHIERKLYFLLVNQRSNGPKKRENCWAVKKCSKKRQCPAWEFQAGQLCWFLSGTECMCTAGKVGEEKMEICRECSVLTSLL